MFRLKRKVNVNVAFGGALESYLQWIDQDMKWTRELNQYYWCWCFGFFRLTAVKISKLCITDP